MKLPTDISQAAKDFLQQSPTFSSPRIDSRNIAAIRQQVRQDYLDGCTRVVEEFRPQIRNFPVGSITVQEVTPRTYSADSPVVFYLFGGGFFTGSPEEDQRIIVPLADALGTKVYAPWYPLSPEHPFPMAMNQVKECYSAILDHTQHSEIFLVGESAGGNLALQILQDCLANRLSMPRAVGLLSPWCDLVGCGDSHHLLDGVDPTLGYQYLQDAARCYCGDQDATAIEVSPLWGQFSSAMPPTFISTGTRDFLLSDAIRLAGRLRQADVSVELNVWEGMWHVFEFYPEIPEARQSINMLSKFLKSHLNV